MRRALPLVALLGLAGCGNPGGDLLALEVNDPGPGDLTRLVVTDDGRGRCDDADLERLDSERLIEAREVEREMEELPGDRSSYPLSTYPAGDQNRRLYRAEGRDASMSWTEGARGAPEVVPKATLLTLRLRRELCGAGDYEDDGN